MFLSGLPLPYLAKKLKVIPVIDVLNGVAVHAVRGVRSEYKPLKSILTDSSEPVEVARTFKSLGFGEVYVADLDAIIDCSEDFGVLKNMVNQTELKLMVDAGVTSTARAEKLLENGVNKIVVGTETLLNKSFVAEAIKRFGSDRIILSLDLKAGKILTKAGFEGPSEPFKLLQEFKAKGLSQVIVLDLTKVGSGEGVDAGFLKKVIAEGLEVYVGGGVRDIKDILMLEALGVSGALVATALHTGKIAVSDLKQSGFL